MTFDLKVKYNCTIRNLLITLGMFDQNQTLTLRGIGFHMSVAFLTPCDPKWLPLNLILSKYTFYEPSYVYNYDQTW